MDSHEMKNTEKDDTSRLQSATSRTNRIMGMTAIFISVLSLFAVIYQSYLAREENELMRIQQSATVLPYLNTWYVHSDGEFKFVVGNKGVGPAFIKEVKITAIDFESKDSLFFDNSDNLIEYMSEKSEILGRASSLTYTLVANTILTQNETREVVTYDYDTDYDGALIREAYENFAPVYNIIYEDVYGTAWIFSSKNETSLKLKREKTE